MSEETKKDKETKKQAGQLENTIKKSEKELKKIQKACNHPKEANKIKDINATGASDLRMICDLCGSVLHYLSKEELDEWTGTNKKE